MERTVGRHWLLAPMKGEAGNGRVKGAFMRRRLSMSSHIRRRARSISSIAMPVFVCRITRPSPLATPTFPFTA